MKNAPLVLIFAALTLSGCNPIGQSRSPLFPLPPPTLKPSSAVGANGLCTEAVLSDLRSLRALAKQLLTTTGKEAEQLQQALNQKSLDFQKTYGKFSCHFQEDGEVKTLNPDQMTVSISEQKTTAEECNDEIKADYLELDKNLKPHLDKMSLLLSGALGDLNAGDKTTGQIAEIHAEAPAALKMLSEFRTRHTGFFTCVILSQDGKYQTVDSDEIDSQIKFMESLSPGKSN